MAPGVVLTRNTRLDEAGIALQPGDMLIVKGDVNALLSMQRKEGLAVSPDLASPALQARSKDLTLAELLVRPASSAIGEVVRDLSLRARHGVVVLAVQRHGIHIRQKVADLPLRFGDVLLIQADAEALTELRDSRQFVLLEGVQEHVLRRCAPKMPATDGPNDRPSWLATRLKVGRGTLGAL